VTQTYRTDDLARWGTGQGFNLTAAQVDINFWDLVQRMIAQEARPDPAAGIDHFEIVGVNMYVHMTDATVLGPYVLPVATFRDRGTWAPSTVYSVMDTFTVNGGLYVVIFDHTSGSTFDPGANDGSGHDYYQLMIQTPGSSLPSGGAVGQLLKKTTTTDYAVGWGFTSADAVDFVPATGSSLTSSNVADALEEVAAGVAAVGRQTIWVPAAAMIPRTSNGPAIGAVEMATNKNMVRTLDFDAATAEYAQFDIAMPKSWDLGTLAFKVFWSHAATTTNFGVAFAIAGVAVSNTDTLDRAFGTAVTVVDTGGTTNTQYVSDETAAMTAVGTPAVGDLIMLRIGRTPSDAGDTLPIDARLHGVQVFYATSTATDD
jgi:hypothetical protein